MKLVPRGVWLAASIAGALLLILGGAALYLTLYPVNLSSFHNEIAAELNAATGRSVKITGNITLGVSLTPTLDVEGLEIANQKWGKAKKFVTVGHTKIRVHLYPLLQGEADIISLEAEHALIHLETDGDARRNWNILAQAVTADGQEAELPEIEEIIVSDIALDYRDIRDATTRFRLHLEQASLKHDVVNGIGSYELVGKLDEHSVEASGKIAPLFTISSKQPRQFDMKAKAFGLSLTADGSAKFPFTEFTYADFTLDAPKGLVQAAAYFGVPVPDIGAMKISGNVTPFGENLHFGNLAANLGDAQTEGFVIIGMGKPLNVNGDLRSKSLDINPYWDMLPDAPPPPPGKLFLANPLDMDFPDGAKLQLRYAVQELIWGEHKFANFLMDGKLEGNVLRFKNLDFDMANGRVETRLSLTPQGKNLALTLNSQAKDLHIEKLLQQFEMPKYAKGKAVLLIEGESSGPDMAALAAGFDGRVFFELREGAIPKRLSSLLRGGITDVLRSVEDMFEGTGKDAKIECGLGAFFIRDGMAENKALLMLTNKAEVTGKGRIDLKEERWHMQLSPRPRDRALISLASDVDINGTLMVPEFHLNKRSVAKNVGKTALGVALGPLGWILGAAGSVISKPGEKAQDGQCDASRAAAFEELQASGAWPELQRLNAGR